MAGNNNENDINEITNFDESAVMNSLEVHSTPNGGQDNKIELNITNEICRKTISFVCLRARQQNKKCRVS